MAPRAKLDARRWGETTSESGLGLDAAVRDRIDERRVVALVLVGVGLGERGDRAIERVTRAEVAGDGDGIPGARVGAGQRPRAQPRVERHRLGPHRGDVGGGLRVPQLAQVEVALPAVVEPRTGLSMGEHCELMAKEWRIGRTEQDELALESHRNAAAAWNAGFYDDLVAPCAGLTTDNNVRRDTDLSKLAALKPVYDRSANGTLTAGNSTPLTDGASCVLLASDEWAQAHGLGVQAYLTHSATAAVDYAGIAGTREGLLMAPTYAVPAMLDRAALTLQDFDIYEIHETRLGRSAPLGAIDRAKLNPKGGSVALGHPFAATGTRILATLAKQLEQRGSGRGIISICTAGGMGVTAILERHPSPVGGPTGTIIA